MFLNWKFYREVTLSYLLPMAPIVLVQSDQSFFVWNIVLVVYNLRLKIQKFVDWDITFCSDIILILSIV